MSKPQIVSTTTKQRQVYKAIKLFQAVNVGPNITVTWMQAPEYTIERIDPLMIQVVHQRSGATVHVPLVNVLQLTLLTEEEPKGAA